jgi:hypothetical protein
MGKKKDKRKILTFENEGLSYDPDVVKCPRNFADFEKYPTGDTREDENWLGVMIMPIFLSRGNVESTPVRIR